MTMKTQMKMMMAYKREQSLAPGRQPSDDVWHKRTLLKIKNGENNRLHQADNPDNLVMKSGTKELF
jgi:hypothetical protein